MGGSVKSRSAPANTHTLSPDMSDLSSVSSASEHDAVKPANAQNNHVKQEDPNKVKSKKNICKFYSVSLCVSTGSVYINIMGYLACKFRLTVYFDLVSIRALWEEEAGS